MNLQDYGNGKIFETPFLSLKSELSLKEETMSPANSFYEAPDYSNVSFQEYQAVSEPVSLVDESLLLGSVEQQRKIASIPLDPVDIVVLNTISKFIIRNSNDSLRV